jgi:adenosine deaminase
MEEHPIDRLYRAGVSLNINSDSRMLTPTTLTKEYETVQRVFYWTEQDLLHANLMGLDSAFVGGEPKEWLRNRFLQAYNSAPPFA